MGQARTGSHRLCESEIQSGWPVRPGRAGQSGKTSWPTMNVDAWQDFELDPRGSSSAPPPFKELIMTVMVTVKCEHTCAGASFLRQHSVARPRVRN